MENKVLKLKNDVNLINDIKLTSGQEIEIVNGVVYINGHMLSLEYQTYFINWITNNPDLFINDTRNWPKRY